MYGQNNLKDMSEQFNFDIKLIFAILNGKVSAAINRKLYRNFRQYNVDITPEQWTVERLNLVVRISGKTDRRINLIHLTKTGRDLEEKSRFIANKTLKEALRGLSVEELSISQEVLRKVFLNTKD